MSEKVSSSPSVVQDYLQLFRLSNVFTALADVAMGFLFVHGTLQPVTSFVCLAIASALLYSAGMVLNDVWDVEQDRQERPSRPIAAGRVPLAQARRVGFGLLLSGVVSGWAAGYLCTPAAAQPWRSGLVATALAFLIVAYDAILKRTWLGPLAMGGCRFLNVLLGMAVALTIAPDTVALGSVALGSVALGFSKAQLLAASGIGIYIVGVTWFARREAAGSDRWQLAISTFVMGSGIAILGLIYRHLPAELAPTLEREETWFLLLGLMAFTIMRRCTVAVREPSPVHVQLAVKNAIWSLIMLDAAVTLLVCHPAWAIAIVTLLIPTMLLGRKITAT